MSVNSQQSERRYTTGLVELRSGSGAGPKVHGYAAVFNRRSQDLGGFVEVIMPGAFDGVLMDDVRALFNHDSNLILARSKAGRGTLGLGVDATGLWYEFEPDSGQTYASNLVRALKRGDVDQSSFAFAVARDGQAWTDITGPGGKAMRLRTITRFARLFDVSPVTYPAYPDTSASQRIGIYSGETVVAGGEEEMRRRRLELAEAES